MVQEFVVLQCCQCRIYQVQQSKKATKWLCKVCNTKQSVKQFFGSGSAKDCRLTVQCLNTHHIHNEDFDPHTGQPIALNTSRPVIQPVNSPNIDHKILDLLLTSDENYDSSDDVSIPKKQRMDESDDQKVPIKSSPVLWTNANQLVSRRVSKWSEFLK